MSLLWIDGFDSYGDIGAMTPTGILSRRYPVTGGTTVPAVVAGRLAGRAVRFSISQDATVYFSPGAITTNGTMVVGVAILFASFPTLGNFLSLYDGTTLGINVRIKADGQIALYRGSTLLAATVAAGVSVGLWCYIELKVLCGVNGTYELRVNETNVLSSADANTKAGTNDYHTTFRIPGIGVGAATSYDDLYCLDGAGAIRNNFLGNKKVETIRPDGAGDSTQWTPDSGANYARVNEAVCVDSSYVQDATTDKKDLYGYSNLPSGTIGISGTQSVTVAQATDASNVTMYQHCKSGATDSSDGGSTLIVGSFKSFARILEQNPDGTVDWVLASVNAAQFGMRN